MEVSQVGGTWLSSMLDSMNGQGLRPRSEEDNESTVSGEAGSCVYTRECATRSKFVRDGI